MMSSKEVHESKDYSDYVCDYQYVEKRINLFEQAADIFLRYANVSEFLAYYRTCYRTRLPKQEDNLNKMHAIMQAYIDELIKDQEQSNKSFLSGFSNRKEVENKLARARKILITVEAAQAQINKLLNKEEFSESLLLSDDVQCFDTPYEAVEAGKDFLKDKKGDFPQAVSARKSETGLNIVELKTDNVVYMQILQKMGFDKTVKLYFIRTCKEDTNEVVFGCIVEDMITLNKMCKNSRWSFSTFPDSDIVWKLALSYMIQYLCSEKACEALEKSGRAYLDLHKYPIEVTTAIFLLFQFMDINASPGIGTTRTNVTDENGKKLESFLLSSRGLAILGSVDLTISAKKMKYYMEIIDRTPLVQKHDDEETYGQKQKIGS